MSSVIDPTSNTNNGKTFSLSTSNKWYYWLAVAFISSANLFIVGFSPDRIGFILGYAIGMFLMPALAARLAWSLSRHKPEFSSAAFNVVLSFLLLSSFLQFISSAELQRQDQQRAAEFSDMMEGVRRAESPEEAHERFTDAQTFAKANFRELANTSSGGSRLVYESLQQAIERVEAQDRVWQAAIDATVELDPFDYKAMKDPRYRERLTNVFEQYIESTKRRLDQFESHAEWVHERLGSIDRSDREAARLAERFLQDFEIARARQAPAYRGVMAAHIALGEAWLRYVALFETFGDGWTSKDGELVLETDLEVNRYNTILDNIVDLENQLNDRARRMAEAF